MKKRPAALCVAFCLLSAAVLAAPSSANLAANPGFESVKGSGQPESWRSDEWNQGMTEFALRSDGAYEGLRYLRIESRDEDDAKFIQDVKVDPNSLYRIRAMARAEGLRTDRKGAYLSVLNIFDGSNSVYDSGGEWKEIVFYGRTAKGQKRIELCLRLGGYSSLNSGRADFDAVSVERIESLPAGAKAVSLQAPASSNKARAAGLPGSDPLVVFLSLLGFCALAYFLDRSRAAASLDSGRYARLAIFALIGVGLALRLPYCFGGYGYSSDLSSFKAWADQALRSRVVFFYRDASFADYPPGYVYVLAALGGIRALFSLSHDSPAYEFLIRLPALACDFGIAIAIHRIVRKRSGEARGLFACALFLLNPAVIQNSAVWGQVDSVFSFAVVASMAFLSEKRYVRAGALYGLAALIKPQAFIFAPVFLCAFVSGKRLKPAVLSVLTGVGTLVAGFLPFLIVHGPLFPFSLYSGTLGSYPYATLNAANLWGVLCLNAQKVSASFLGMSIGAWGTLAIVLIALASCLAFFLMRRARGDGRDPIFETAAFLILGTFCFSVKMHERYLYPLLPLVACAWAGRSTLRIPWFAAISSLLCYLNVSLVYRSSKAGTYHIPPQDPYFIVLSALELIAFIAYLALMRPEPTFDRGRRDSCPPSEMGKRISDGRGFALLSEGADSTDAKFRIAAIAALTVLCLAMALTGLGDANAPGKGWKPSRSGESTVLDLGKESELGSFSWYSGIGDGEFSLRHSADGSNWSEPIAFKPELYSWKNKELPVQARFVEIKAKSPGGLLLELALWGKGGEGPLAAADVSGSEALTDEGSLAKPFARYTDSMVFDEIYHGRTAFEHLNSMEPYEWTHPPLGKLMIALGINAFGMNPFGWRIVCALFGALLVPLFYSLALKVFPRGNLALGAAAVYAMDFMRFTQSRLALVDVYVVFFVIASYVFMYRYYLSALGDGKPDYACLALSGLFFGLGAATKWNAIYSGAGLAASFFIAFVSRLRRELSGKKRSMGRIWAGACGVLGLCVLCFIVVPLAIYAASYIPTFSVPGHGWRSVWNYQGRMLEYHSKLKAEHSFSSPWWQWPWLVKPVWYFKADGLPAGLSSTIVASGNPLIWLPSLVAAVAAIFISLWRRDARFLPIILGFFAQYLPWVLVPRLTFLYHYFPAIPFSLLCIVYCVQALMSKGAWTGEPSAGKRGEKRNVDGNAENGTTARFPAFSAWISKDTWIWIYAAACAFLFLCFLPALSGMTVPGFWIFCLRWSPSWFF